MSIKVTHIKPEFTDERGFISRLVDNDNIHFRAVLLITSKAGTIRGNHYPELSWLVRAVNFL